MILEMFAIHDRMAGFYAPPFFMPAVGLARRAMLELASDPSTNIGRHPGDFSLYHLGTFNDQTGVVEMNQSATFLCGALELLNVRPAMPAPLFDGARQEAAQ